MKTQKIFGLDTNVILLDSSCLYSFEENDIAIPIQVIMELDNHKMGTESKNFNAREALRTIESLPSKQLYDGGASLGEGRGKLRIIVGYPYHGEVKKIFPEQTMDHLILNAIYCLAHPHGKKAKEPLPEVIIVSKDVNLRLKAGALGLIAEDYKNDIVPNAKSLYEEARTIEVSNQEITNLYSEKKIFPSSINDFYENEFLILKSPDNSALATFKKGHLQLIIKEHMIPMGIVAANAEQAFAFSALLDPKITLVTIAGVAGTGKTILALAAGLHLFSKKHYDQINFTREAIGLSGKEIGFLPGGVNDKLSPYMKGIYDNIKILQKISDNNTKLIDKSMTEGRLILEAVVYIRGRSIADTFFIVDEAQNLTRKEAKAIVTRAGEGTKMVLIGDVTQIDVPYLDESSNGLSHVIASMKGQATYAHITLMKGERSELAELAGRLL